MRIFFFLLIFSLVLVCSAQRLPPTDSLSIDTVEISVRKLSRFSEGQAFTRIDSAALSRYTTGSLADVLGQNSHSFVRNYGPGGLSSPSLRGSSSAHTAILWQGLNLQSPLYGQVDLSLFPAMLFDELSVQYGGSSALFGSGAIGGAIHLGSKRGMPGVQAGGAFSAGSFGLQQQSLQVQTQSKAAYASVRTFRKSSANDFAYRLPGSAASLRQTHAAWEQTGFLAEAGLYLSKKQSLSAHVWKGDARRELPQYAVQTDAFTRALLTWKRKTARTETQARLAWLNERIEYQDSVSKTDSRSRARTLVGELEVHARPYPGTYLEAGWQSLHIQAFTNTYGNLDPVQYRQAAYASWQQQLFRERAQASLSLRQEWRQSFPIPLMPAAGISYRLTPRLSLSARGSRNYRLPTLNDLYWNPGGNPNLRPEDSWSAEAGVAYSILPHPGKWRFSGQSQLYSSRTRDWIIWLPEGSYWTPQNLQRVWARGIEQSFRLERNFRTYQLFADLRYTYCRSTQQQAIRENDASLHKQLIYVPVHQGHMNLGVTGKSYTLIYEQGFTGKRFTSSDNYGSLPAFATGNLFFSLQKCLTIPRSRKIALGVSLRCDNLWNARYQVIAGRPMPGRNYLASLSVRGAAKS